MARKVDNPRWREEWYEMHQSRYVECLEQARRRGVQDESGSILHGVGAVEDFLAHKLHITQSVVRSWRRREGRSGATYPQDEDTLLCVMELLGRPAGMTAEDRAAASALYQDFCHLVQGSGRAFLWERGKKYREFMEWCGFFAPSRKWKYINTEKRCELAGKLLRGGLLTQEECRSLLDFYTGFPSPENCGANVFRQLCQSELVWYKAEEILKRCTMAQEKVNAWLIRVEDLSEKRVSPGNRIALSYWKIMDEYMEEWLDRIPNQSKVRDFNIVRALAKGYIPPSFRLRFGYDDADYESLKEEYLLLPLRYDSVTLNSRRIRVEEYADVYDWFLREKKRHGISIENYRKQKGYFLRREVKEALLQSGKLSAILDEWEKGMGAKEIPEEFKEYLRLNAMDRSACMLLDCQRYQREHPGAFRMGFANGEQAKEAVCFYEGQKLSVETKEELAAEYFLFVLGAEYFPSWLEQPGKGAPPLFTRELEKLLGEKLMGQMSDYLLYRTFGEQEFLGHLFVMQEALALRKNYLPGLADYVERLPQEVLAGEKDPAVLEVIRKLENCLEQ